MVWIAAAVLVAILVGFVIWGVKTSRESGAARERDAQRQEADERRRAGDEVMAEPIADEDDWLARARRRLARLRDEQADD